MGESGNKTIEGARERFYRGKEMGKERGSKESINHVRDHEHGKIRLDCHLDLKMEDLGEA